jgi:hypothetical protein
MKTIPSINKKGLFQGKFDHITRNKTLTKTKIQNNNQKKNSISKNNLKKVIIGLSFFFFQILNEKRVGKVLIPTPSNASEINLSNLRITKEDIIDENFLFSKNTTQKTNIEIEIDEIEDDEFRYKNWRNTQIGLAIGGSGVGMWFAYKGLNAWEKWMKEQEQKDIEEEIEMTGTYINPGAGNVDASIDPVTGKKIVIKEEKKSEKDQGIDEDDLE